MYEALTVEDIKYDILSRISTDIDTREGSFTNDMISTVAYEIWKLYQSLDAVVPIVFVDETSGEYIDKRCAEYGIKRKPGTKATTILKFTGTDGTMVPQGKSFLTVSGLEFTADENTMITDGIAEVKATAAEIGEEYNVTAGTITRQFINLSGLNSVTNLDAMGGSNQETDEALVKRFYEYLQKPATSGNTAHYRQWALEVNGVGNAKVKPLWDGPGSVKILIVGNNNGPVDSAIVTNCLSRIEENRPIGADVTVVSAEGIEINVEATLTIDGSTTIDIVKEVFVSALDDYLRGIAFKSYTVVFNRIAYMLLGISGVVDYTSLTINGGVDNIVIGEDQVPIIGLVVVE